MELAVRPKQSNCVHNGTDAPPKRSIQTYRKLDIPQRTMNRPASARMYQRV